MRTSTRGASTFGIVGRSSLLLFVAAILLSPSGCGSGGGKGSEETRAPPPDLRPADVEGIKGTVAAERGKVVVLDFWATWCSPCRKQFAHLGEWLDKFGRDNLAAIAVSLDDPDTSATKVLPFLRSHRTAGIELLLYTGSDHDRMVNAIDPEWGGEIPALFLYDRSGRLVRPLTGEHEPAEIESLIKDLLATGTPAGNPSR